MARAALRGRLARQVAKHSRRPEQTMVQEVRGRRPASTSSPTEAVTSVQPRPINSLHPRRAMSERSSATSGRPLRDLTGPAVRLDRAEVVAAATRIMAAAERAAAAAGRAERAAAVEVLVSHFSPSIQA